MQKNSKIKREKWVRPKLTILVRDSGTTVLTACKNSAWTAGPAVPSDGSYAPSCAKFAMELPGGRCPSDRPKQTGPCCEGMMGCTPGETIQWGCCCHAPACS